MVSSTLPFTWSITHCAEAPICILVCVLDLRTVLANCNRPLSARSLPDRELTTPDQNGRQRRTFGLRGGGRPDLDANRCKQCSEQWRTEEGWLRLHTQFGLSRLSPQAGTAESNHRLWFRASIVSFSVFGCSPRLSLDRFLSALLITCLPRSLVTRSPQ